MMQRREALEPSRSIYRTARPRRLAFGLVAVAFIAVAASAPGADWQSTLTKDPPGRFPPLRSLHARYSFGWSGITAATSEIRFSGSSENRDTVDASGRTIGFVRALWRFDVTHHAAADATTFRPLDAKQVEATRGKTITTTIAFNSSGVTRTRADSSSKSGPAKPKHFDFPNLYDLQSGMLYLRSLPLNDHASYRVLVYPTANAYLATVTITGRERISVRAGSYNAIKMDLNLSKVSDHQQLQPHKKFRRATVWVTDDPDRIILRIEAQIFVGTVFAELQSIQFDSPSR